MSKTTIAIDKESRKILQKIKLELEAKQGKFVDMDEVIKYLIEEFNKQ